MSVETSSHNYTNMNLIFSQFVAADFFKKESRSPRGFLPRSRIFSCWKIPRPLLARLRSLRPCEATLLTLLRAGESVAPPPLPQKNSGGAHHFRFLFFDLCIRFGKIISKACPVGNLFSFGVCEGFNSGASQTKIPR